MEIVDNDYFLSFIRELLGTGSNWFRTEPNHLEPTTSGFGCGSQKFGTEPLVVVLVPTICSKTGPNRTAAALQDTSLDPDVNARCRITCRIKTH